MNLALISLVKLQRLDGRIVELKRAEAEGPEKLTEVDQELNAAEDKVRQSLALEEEMKKRRRELEREIEDTDEKIKQNQVRQLQVKTNEEYRALLKENDYLKKSNAQREDEILALMEDLERTSAENESLKVWLEEKRETLSVKREEIEAWMAQCLKDQTPLDMERSSLVKDIPKEMERLYQRIFKARQGRAIAPIISGICQECHMQIPPQDYNELQRNEKIMVCPHCDRILYWGDHEDYQGI